MQGSPAASTSWSVKRGWPTHRWAPDPSLQTVNVISELATDERVEMRPALAACGGGSSRARSLCFSSLTQVARKHGLFILVSPVSQGFQHGLWAARNSVFKITSRLLKPVWTSEALTQVNIWQQVTPAADLLVLGSWRRLAHSWSAYLFKQVCGAVCHD